MTLALHATPEEVMRAVRALETFAQAQGVPAKDIFGLTLALEECGSNIVNHALQRDARRLFHVSLDRTADAFLIELRDDGPPFDPTATPERAAQAEEDDVPGGWGVQLVRRYTDQIHYTREAGENVLRLTKHLKPAAPSA